MSYQISKDVIMLPERMGRVILLNVFARTAIAVESTALKSLHGTKPTTEEQELKVWTFDLFPTTRGLLTNPTPYVQNIEEWSNPLLVSYPKLIEIAKQYYIIIEDKTEYYKRFALKEDILDSKHFGNFHQQLGWALLKERKIPSTWWMRQKFTEDLTEVKEGLYRAIQKYALNQYFKKTIKQGMTILDIGCGTGIYARMMASFGANVIGVDPSEEYLTVAKNLAVQGEDVSYKLLPVGEAGALNSIEDSSVDMIFMSDALLFYFTPLFQKSNANIQILLDDIKRILKPQGCFISLEPHFQNWLKPWLGEPEHPFTVFSEYANQKFSVTADMSTFIQAFAKAGFALSWFEELKPDPAYKETDFRAYSFAKEFPLWQLSEWRYIQE